MTKCDCPYIAGLRVESSLLADEAIDLLEIAGIMAHGKHGVLHGQRAVAQAKAIMDRLEKVEAAARLVEEFNPLMRDLGNRNARRGK